MRTSDRILSEKYILLKEDEKDDIMSGLEELDTPRAIADQLVSAKDYKEFYNILKTNFNILLPLYDSADQMYADQEDYEPGAGEGDGPEPEEVIDPIGELLKQKGGTSLFQAYDLTFYGLKCSKGLPNLNDAEDPRGASLKAFEYGKDAFEWYKRNGKKERIYENDKEDILAGLDAAEQDVANIGKKATALFTYGAGDVEIVNDVDIPTDAASVDSDLYKSKPNILSKLNKPSGATIYYKIIEDGQTFVWYFTNPVHKNAINVFYDEDGHGYGYVRYRGHRAYERACAVYENLFEKLSQFPPYTQWEQQVLGEKKMKQPLAENDKEDIMAGLEQIQSSEREKVFKASLWNAAVKQAVSAIDELNSLSRDRTLQEYFAELSIKFNEDEDSLTVDEEAFYYSSIGFEDNIRDLVRRVGFD